MIVLLKRMFVLLDPGIQTLRLMSSQFLDVIVWKSSRPEVFLHQCFQEGDELCPLIRDSERCYLRATLFKRNSHVLNLPTKSLRQTLRDLFDIISLASYSHRVHRFYLIMRQ